MKLQLGIAISVINSNIEKCINESIRLGKRMPSPMEEIIATNHKLTRMTDIKKELESMNV
jgi:hypothetical protein